MPAVVDFARVELAARTLSGIAKRTPVMRSRTANKNWGAEFYFKCENFQRAGAFKFRGAYFALSQLSDSERSAGVLTFSSGNHAQALALAGSILDTKVTVVMPSDAPALKVAATKGYGAEVILYDREETSREALGAKIASEKGLAIIPPYDHPDIVAGQGTAAKELIEEVGDIDLLITPAGGGGLLAGSSISARALCPDIRVYGVEPHAGDDICQSFRSGKIEDVAMPDTIADGARTTSPGAIPFEIIKRNVSGMISVSDSTLIKATKFYAERMKIVVEPTGCLSLAGVMEGKVDVSGLKVGILISGGNVDLARLAQFWQS